MKNAVLSLALLMSAPVLCQDQSVTVDTCSTKSECDWGGVTLDQFNAIMDWTLGLLYEEVGLERAQALETQCPGILELRLKLLELENAAAFENLISKLANFEFIKTRVDRLRQSFFADIQEGEVEKLQAAIQELQEIQMKKIQEHVDQAVAAQE